MSVQPINQDLLQAIHGYNQDYEQGKSNWFSYFADDALIYPIGASAPFQGREAYRQNFQQLLTGVPRTMKVLEQNIRMTGDTAVVTQLLLVTQSDVAVTLRESSIWKLMGNDWKIIHLHVSLIGTPRSEVPVNRSNDVDVLEERIATVSTQVGVAQ